MQSDVEVITSDHEMKLASVWSEVLNIPLDTIGRNTSFFSVGGDSLTVIKVISALKRIGLETSVADIFKYHTLKLIANSMKYCNNNTISWPQAKIRFEISIFGIRN